MYFISDFGLKRLCPLWSLCSYYTVHGILQARVLEWVAFPFSRGSSQPRDWTQVSCIAGRVFSSWATRETLPKKGNVKECSNDHTVALIPHASKVMLKILQARLQQYVNHEFLDVHAGLRKGRGTRDQIANIHWIIEKAREFHKTSISALLTMPKPLTMWITTNCGKFWKRWEYLTPPDLPLEKSVCRSGSNS